VTCDLCGGDPLCVKVCENGALRFEDVEAAISEKRSRYAQMALAGEEESL
jgi:ferredoxin